MRVLNFGQVKKLGIGMKKQRGIGLLELMLALAVIALLLLMATRYYTVTRTSQQAVAATQDVGFIVSAIKSWRASEPNYANVSIDAIYHAGGFPSGFSNDGSGTVIGPLWLGCPPKMTLDPVGGADHEKANLTITGLKSEICVSLNQRFSTADTSWVTPAGCGPVESLQKGCNNTITLTIEGS